MSPVRKLLGLDQEALALRLLSTFFSCVVAPITWRVLLSSGGDALFSVVAFDIDVVLAHLELFVIGSDGCSAPIGCGRCCSAVRGDETTVVLLLPLLPVSAEECAEDP